MSKTLASIAAVATLALAALPMFGLVTLGQSFVG